MLYNQLGQLTPGDLLALLSAYAAAARHSPSAYSHELFAALTEFLWEGLNEVDARGLADIAAGYAAVDHYEDDEDFFRAVATAALHKLEVRRQGLGPGSFRAAAAMEERQVHCQIQRTSQACTMNRLPAPGPASAALLLCLL